MVSALTITLRAQVGRHMKSFLWHKAIVLVSAAIFLIQNELRRNKCLAWTSAKGRSRRISDRATSVRILAEFILGTGVRLRAYRGKRG